jgi:hypothetical protein
VYRHFDDALACPTPRVLCRAVILVLGDHEAGVATDDALAEVSTIRASADAER